MNTNNMTQYCARLEPSPISLYFLRKCEMGALKHINMHVNTVHQAKSELAQF